MTQPQRESPQTVASRWVPAYALLSILPITDSNRPSEEPWPTITAHNGHNLWIRLVGADIKEVKCGCTDTSVWVATDSTPTGNGLGLGLKLNL